jgi:alcohol-forming fatty acyl-CoA reductase
MNDSSVMSIISQVVFKEKFEKKSEVLFNQKVFSKICETNPSVLSKIILINGDIDIDNLGLSEKHEKILIDEIDVIFHCAASVRFEDPLKEAVNTNVCGTLRLLQLAQKIKNLKVFSYMSTAFSQSYQNELEEKFYPTNIDVFGLIEQTQKLDQKSLKNLEIEL